MVYRTSLEIASASAWNVAYKPQAVTFDGRQLAFRDLRIEGFEEEYYSVLSGDSLYNTIDGGYMEELSVADCIADADRLAADISTGRETSLVGGSSAYPVLHLRTRSSGYEALKIWNSADANPSVAVAGDGTTVIGDGTDDKVTLAPDGSVTLAPVATPTPAEGMIYYDSTANKLKVYTGAAWEEIESA